MNSNIRSYLDIYINYENPQFAVMLTGKWGCGKTYFIKDWIRSVELLKEKKYKPIYISLYGIHSLAELRENINRQLHPFLTSSFVKTTKKIACGFAKTMIKCDLGGGKDSVEVNYELDLLPLLQSDNKEIKESGKIFVFDDLERCYLNKVELLGFINFFVEHCACKVIVLCNEDKMLVPSETKVVKKEPIEGVKERWVVERSEAITDKEYKEFKEKTVGVTFEIKSDIQSAIGSFISEVKSDPHNLLTDMKPYLQQMLEKAGKQNLRVIRQCILDFNSVVSEIPAELFEKEGYIPVMRKFFLDFVITSLEIKAGNPLFDNIDNLAYAFLPGDTRSSITSLVQSYSEVPQKLGIEVLDYESVKIVNSFIRYGTFPSQALISQIEKKNATLKPWESLAYYWNLSNEDFETNYKLTLEHLQSHHTDNIDELISIAFKLVNFDRLELKKLHEKNFLRDVLLCFNRFLGEIKTQNGVVSFKKDLYSRLQYYSFEEEVALWMKLVKELNREMDKRISRRQSEMTNLMENLSGDNLTSITRLLDSINPVTRRSYTDSPIFDVTNPKKVAKGVISLSNEGRTQFKEILSYHYTYLNASNYSEHKWYDGERENVKKIIELLKKKKLKGVDKYTVNQIVLQFEKLIDRVG